MNKEQAAGIFRNLFSAGLAFAVGKGYIDAGTAGDVATGLAIVGASVWSYFSNKPGTVIPVAK